jgi:DNA replication protein DnaC
MELTPIQQEFYDSLSDGEFKQRMYDAFIRNNTRRAEMGDDKYEKMMKDRQKADDEEYQKKQAIERNMRLVEKSGLKDLIDEKTFENFKVEYDWQKNMLDMCRRFIAQTENKFLYISGQSGCGKTHLGVATSSHFLRGGIQTIYTTFEAMMDNFRASVNDDEYDDDE